MNEASTPRTARRSTRRRRLLDRLVPILLVLGGLVVILYPVIATYYNNYRQHEFARQYQGQVSQAPPVTLQRELARARQYNATLPEGLLKDPWDPKSSAMSAAYRAYLDQLHLFDSMATLRVPSIHVDLPIYHGTSDETLSRGVGHLFGSSLPVGGRGTHAALTGHSALDNATLFDHLPDVRVGETFYIDVYGETLAYRVDQIRTVLPTQLDDLDRQADADLVTLITCTPHGVNTHRLLVRGHRVPYDPAHDTAKGQQAGMDWSIQSWMIPRLIGAGVALLLLLWLVATWIRDGRRRRRREAARSGPRPDTTEDRPAHTEEPDTPPGPTPPRND